MANSVYQINKGINRSIEFKGLKAQYIWYMGGGLVVLMLVYALLYMMGLNQYLCMMLVFPAGAYLVYKVYWLSDTYGEHGLMKMLAKHSIPKLIKCNSRRVFRNLKPAGKRIVC
jgi:hypothetical protein